MVAVQELVAVATITIPAAVRNPQGPAVDSLYHICRRLEKLSATDPDALLAWIRITNLWFDAIR